MVKLVNMYPESSDIVSKLSSVDVVKKMLDLMDESVLVGYPKKQ
jgi:hypothetical protein